MTPDSTYDMNSEMKSKLLIKSLCFSVFLSLFIVNIRLDSRLKEVGNKNLENDSETNWTLKKWIGLHVKLVSQSC